MKSPGAARKSDVLLVDDDEGFLCMAQSILEDAGNTVRPFSGVGPALAGFRSRKPDIAVVDVGLPDGDGFGLCRAMKAESPETPIIFITGWADVNSRLRGFQAGAQDYMLKPPCWDELVARVRVHLQAKAQREVLAKRNYELELQARVRRDASDMIVHDLKTPLSSILGTLELIRSQGLISPTQYRRLIDVSRSATEMMLLMINDILDLERAEETDLRAEIGPVDVRALVGKVGALFTPLCLQRKIICHAESQVAQAWTDPRLLFRVLSNLVANAVKFSPEGGEVALSCERVRELLRFEVVDRGPGIPERYKEKVFEKFVQLRVEGGDRGGAGIGLAFCRLASRILQGRVWAEDREGGGSRFLFEIPAKSG